MLIDYKSLELSQRLSDMIPIGLIDVDESIHHTCHFGFGNGRVHLGLAIDLAHRLCLLREFV